MTVKWICSYIGKRMSSCWQSYGEEKTNHTNCMVHIIWDGFFFIFLVHIATATPFHHHQIIISFREGVFFRMSLHHSHKIRFFLCIFQTYTENTHNRNQLRNSILCHIAFCLFISLFVSFSAWLNYLMCKTYTAECTEMSCVVKPNFDMHLILLN